MLIVSNGKVRFTDETYDKLLRLATWYLPGIGAGFFILSFLVDLPHVRIVLGIVVLYSFAIGVLLNISAARRVADSAAYDGQILVEEPKAPDEPRVFSLLLYKGPEVLEHKKSVSFKVNHGEIPVVEFTDDEDNLAD